MKWLLIYNGRYEAKIAGPEIRYLRLAEQIVSANDEVTIVVKNPKTAILPSRVKSISGAGFFSLLKNIVSSDIIVLHGGKPHLVFICALLSIFKRNSRFVLDAYAPHWIELSIGSKPSTGLKKFKHIAKISYNVTRTFFCCSFFDGVIVANRRQADLLRGFMSTTSGIKRFPGIWQIPFACDPPPDNFDKMEFLTHISADRNEKGFYVGWLGGLWDWMDFSIIAKPLSNAIRKNRNINFVLFGANESSIKKVLAEIDSDVIENIHFVNWVNFSDRLKIWSGLDVALVWGGDGVENDYASRTRNFDCLSSGLPIIQNDDDDWGPLISEMNIGCICNPSTLENSLLNYSNNPNLQKSQSLNAISLSKKLSWLNFYRTLRSNSLSSRKDHAIIQLISLILLLTILPLIVILIIINNRNE